jgi:hypothetical protein
MSHYMVGSDAKVPRSRDVDQCKNKKMNLHPPHSSSPEYFSNQTSYSSFESTNVVSNENGKSPKMRTLL